MPLVLIPLMLGYGKPDIFYKIRDFGKSSQTQPTDSPDNEVFTNFPVDQSNWFFKTLKQGKTIYDIKNKRRKSDNNAAHVNNIIPDNREDFNPDIKNNVQNNKEQDMALIDELKKLITKVENDKGEDMDDKEKVCRLGLNLIIFSTNICWFRIFLYLDCSHYSSYSLKCPFEFNLQFNVILCNFF